MQRIIYFTLALVSSLLLLSCATYYSKNINFNKYFEANNYSKAREELEKNKKKNDAKNQVLYDLNYATTSFFMGDYAASIENFKKADTYFDDYVKNYGYEALALISNPMVKPYSPEYFERVMLHFYQALNFINISDYESAMVECRKMNLELNKLSDQFKKHDGKRYSQDAFGHYIMGFLYETMGNHNDAFIAYRNASKIYTDDYLPMYGLKFPDNLKRALVRSAYKTGFADEGMKYEKNFKITYKPAATNSGRLVAFVFNGLSPIKSEKSINFVNVKGSGSSVSFVNAETGLAVPIYLSSSVYNRKEQAAITDLTSIRLALPQYVSRPTRCATQNTLSVNGKNYNLDIVEDIDKIAKQSLRDRHWLEVGSSIARVAVKQTLSQTAKNQNEYLGLLVNVTNAITERADTRNWQTLPSNIQILDIELPEGEHVVRYNACGKVQTVNVTIKSGRTSFITTLRNM